MQKRNTCAIVAFATAAVLCLSLRASGQQGDAKSPYPPSSVIARINWDWTTLKTAAPGSDLWPVTWANDGSIFTAFGDGGGFGGTDRDGRVAAGFARIDGPPEKFTGINVNGGKDAAHPASFPKKGKVGGILAVGDRIYGWLNTQNNRWPEVDQALIWSDDGGATWKQSDWVFSKGNGNLKPSTFLNFGKGYTGVPPPLEGYVYFYGQRQGVLNEFYMGRAPREKVTDRASYEFVSSIEKGAPRWTSDVGKARPIFADTRPNHDTATVVYVAALKRYLLSTFHDGPGELSIFDSANPWGPWTTVAYEEHWGQMSHDGEGLTCSFPTKWMSDDGLTMWCVFAVYGGSAKEGINGHDRFNLVKATLELKR
ncbi:MAG TPA: DUF4185 domain-containing protein [Humisphaera sp.]|jgi:hypothetical protein|nr:DUF4185 domain-containing protein [Humisphaera sp.]